MKTVIEMAREAGWKDLRDYDSEMHDDIFMGKIDSLKAFAALVRADEREAMVAEAAKKGWGMRNDDPFEDCVREIADIRARGNA